MSDFIKGFLLTAVPAVAISVVSAVGYHASGSFDEGIGFLFLWLLALVAFIVTLILGLSSSLFRNKGIARAGVLAGIGIAVVSLGASCFVLFQ